jgi:hypothetical protein
MKKRGLFMLATPSCDVVALCGLLVQRHVETKLHLPITQFEIPKRC